MKLLLDENLPHQLRNELIGHDVYTVAFMQWSGIQNGKLLRLAADNGFDALVTNDRGLEYQQNLNQLPLTVVVLLGEQNTIEAVRLLIPDLLITLSSIAPCTFSKIASP